jgi:hypothetical protein
VRPAALFPIMRKCRFFNQASQFRFAVGGDGSRLSAGRAILFDDLQYDLPSSGKCAVNCGYRRGHRTRTDGEHPSRMSVRHLTGTSPIGRYRHFSGPADLRIMMNLQRLRNRNRLGAVVGNKIALSIVSRSKGGLKQARVTPNWPFQKCVGRNSELSNMMKQVRSTGQGWLCAVMNPPALLRPL